MGFLKNNYGLVWRYLKESKNYFFIILFLFFISILLGFIFPVFFVEHILEIMEELMKRTEGMGFTQLLFFILENNFRVAFFGLLTGIVLGLIPLLLTFFNGYVIGFVSNMAVGQAGFIALINLVPHGIFEIPAIILSLGLGLKLGMFVFKKKGRKKQFFYDLENSLRVFLFVILPLLIIAAVIESWLISLF